MWQDLQLIACQLSSQISQITSFQKTLFFVEFLQDSVIHAYVSRNLGETQQRTNIDGNSSAYEQSSDPFHRSLNLALKFQMNTKESGQKCGTNNA